MREPQAAPEALEEQDATESTELVRAVSAGLAAGEADRVRELLSGLKAPDLADLIEVLSEEDRPRLVAALGADFDVEALSELDTTVRDRLSEALPTALLAKAVTELETDDAAYVIEGLEASEQREVLAQVPRLERLAVERALEHAEGTAGRLMQPEVVAVPPIWNVGSVIDHMRESADLPDRFAEIYVVDADMKVQGAVELSRLLRTKREVAITAIMEPEVRSILATTPEEEVARQFKRYDLISAPVTDDSGRLIGVVTVDDIVEVIHDQAEESIKTLAGVGDETLSDDVVDIARSRIPWLVVNLGTAILASIVIRQFGATIEQMVALAALMPIVASMGGNAGTQTMTVTVRALATNKLGRVNAGRVISRETAVGLINGAVLSLIIAAVVFLWFGSGKLGLVIGAAMIVNLLAAAVAGILIPLTLDRLDLDPAPASGVFVTTVTDVVGFFVFLGLASLWLV
jgi:magnesium transporter